VNSNEKDRKLAVLISSIMTVVITVGVIIFLVILFNSTNKETETVLSDTSFEVKGMYGAVYPYKEILSVELKDTIPEITMKTNGAAIGAAKKGYFTVEGLGKCKLFLLSKEGPYVFIKTKDSYVIINYSDKNKTEALYNDLADKMKK
jgi:hypothetical protein